MADATLKEIMTALGMTPSDFSKEWKKLSDTDKAQLKIGIGNGTLTY
jgi:hypothetical protein